MKTIVQGVLTCVFFQTWAHPRGGSASRLADPLDAMLGPGPDTMQDSKANTLRPSSPERAFSRAVSKNSRNQNSAPAALEDDDWGGSSVSKMPFQCVLTLSTVKGD